MDGKINTRLYPGGFVDWDGRQVTFLLRSRYFPDFEFLTRLSKISKFLMAIREVLVHVVMSKGFQK